MSTPALPGRLGGHNVNRSPAMGLTEPRIQGQRGIYGAGSVSVLQRQTANLEMSSLIVNNEPELPLKVPLEYCSLPIGQKVEDLKKRNMDRHESAAVKLGELAERERLLYLEKLKKRKKMNKLVEEQYRNERTIAQSQLQDRYAR